LTNLLTQIAEARIGFSKNDEIIANHIVSNPEQCAMLTIQQLSALTGVSDASIVRFAKRIGLSGYQELRAELRARLSDSLSATRRIEKSAASGDSTPNYLSDFIGLQIGYINQLTRVVASAEFQQLVSYISNARALYLYEDGGASMSPGNTLQFWLSRFGLQVIRITPSGHRLFDQIVHHKPSDMLVGFCFGKDNPDLSNLLEYTNQRHILSYLITDYPHGYTASLCANHIVLERGPLEIFHSMSVPVLFCESIALSIAHLKGPITSQVLRELDELRKKHLL